MGLAAKQLETTETHNEIQNKKFGDKISENVMSLKKRFR